MTKACILAAFATLMMMPSMGSLADGIPVNAEHKITVPHSVIDLSDDQIDEIESLGTLTLTSAQFEKLRKLSPGISRRYTHVLSLEHIGCTCFDYPFCLRMDEKHAAIIHEEFDLDRIRWKMGESSFINIYADSKGGFYLNGVAIPLPMLLQSIDLGPKKHSPDLQPKEMRLAVILPAAINKIPKKLHDTLKQIEMHAIKHGWQFTEPKTDKELQKSGARNST